MILRMLGPYSCSKLEELISRKILFFCLNFDFINMRTWQYKHFYKHFYSSASESLVILLLWNGKKKFVFDIFFAEVHSRLDSSWTEESSATLAISGSSHSRPRHERRWPPTALRSGVDTGCIAAHRRTADSVQRARSRLYRSQILQVNMRLKALAEIYTMHSFAQL